SLDYMISRINVEPFCSCSQRSQSAFIPNCCSIALCQRLKRLGFSNENTMIYLDLLKLASPEAIIAVTALAVLGIGLASTRASGVCSFAATVGLALAICAVLILPRQATLFHGMLLITPLTSLFNILSLALAFFPFFLS